MDKKQYELSDKDDRKKRSLYWLITVGVIVIIFNVLIGKIYKHKNLVDSIINSLGHQEETEDTPIQIQTVLSTPSGTYNGEYANASLVVDFQEKHWKYIDDCYTLHGRNIIENYAEDGQNVESYKLCSNLLNLTIKPNSETSYELIAEDSTKIRNQTVYYTNMDSNCKVDNTVGEYKGQTIKSELKINANEKWKYTYKEIRLSGNWKSSKPDHYTLVIEEANHSVWVGKTIEIEIVSSEPKYMISVESTIDLIESQNYERVKRDVEMIN